MVDQPWTSRAPGSLRSRTGSATPRLTRREWEVLQLIAAGWTDRAIADALFISCRTVTTHVTRILRKLGVGSRVGAATYAVRHGIA
jgi:DNA-binding NarL/FixJ family response regulator